MYGHKIIQKNIKKCETAGIKILELSIEKNKAKMSNIQEIIANVFREIDKKDLKNKKILIIGGPTAESIDDIRIITNRSSGKTAVSLAKNAFYRGADVDLLYGYGKEYVPEHINKTDFESIKDIQKFINKKNLKEYDIIIICAALSDYMPKKQKGKIPSGMDKLSVDMSPAPKIISQIRKKTPETKIIGFKAEEKTTKLKEKAFNLLKKNNLDFVIANTISGFSNESNDIWIINKNKKTVHKKGKKEILADFILDTIK
jgi:phosphopantothenoylcysteine decarboxylase/phosphopantothenate--cysteine ligase